MDIKEKQDEIISEFSFFEDWMDKYAYIIDLGKELELIEERDKREENLIRGCQSRVWLVAESDADGNMKFKADSDAIITKGIIALLIRVVNGEKPETVAREELYFVDKIGLKEHLSPTRSNGLLSMIKQMKYYAIALAGK
ncbi:MAG: Fe-S metabolism protein SufE [Ignavibacteriae bacterium HGW-Ignavibacteriae-4]|jgi:cysteine desulfuration protein SufE|nr:MAG: Fe-S metabolism protein SufE [Ignavibacteriae bacterium HGW-Ignavibacteriae-4]